MRGGYYFFSVIVPDMNQSLLKMREHSMRRCGTLKITNDNDKGVHP